MLGAASKSLGFGAEFHSRSSSSALSSTCCRCPWPLQATLLSGFALWPLLGPDLESGEWPGKTQPAALPVASWVQRGSNSSRGAGGLVRGLLCPLPACGVG